MEFRSCIKDCLIFFFLSSFPFASGRGNKAHNSFIRFSYKDGDVLGATFHYSALEVIKYWIRFFRGLGPDSWDKLPDGESVTMYCKYIPEDEDDRFWTPGTPLNINTGQATLPIRDIEQEFDLNIKKHSLTFHVVEGINNMEWSFGYPVDGYHGVEIRGPRLGIFEVTDLYDAESKPTMYDFQFATLTFCDFKTVTNQQRSSHQLDGKRYPLEINMLFFSEPRKIGLDNNVDPESDTSKIIMISILGEVGQTENILLNPIVDAAKLFKGGNFDVDDTDGSDFSIKIKGNFSLSWLLPLQSGNFYYKDGSFPVPPCYPLGQVYVFEKPISISQKQLDILTKIYTEREPDKKFTCTFGVLRKEIETTKIYYNPYSWKLVGDDNKPLTVHSKGNRIVHPSLYFFVFIIIYL